MAGTRLSGLISGMDTESIISQLVDAKKVNVNKTKKKQISLNYKQEAWKSLNTKIKNLQQKFVSNMRFTSSYAKKTTKVSNASAVSVITGENAVNGVQTLEVKQLAKTGYLTGSELGDGKQGYTALSTMEDLGVKFDASGKGVFTVQAGGEVVDIDVTKDTSISDILGKIKSAGLNASFDEKNQRFFISAKESGASNDFSITASDANGSSVLSALGLQTNLSKDEKTLAQYKEFDKYYVADAEGNMDVDATKLKLASLINQDVDSKVSAYMKQFEEASETISKANDKIDEINKKYSDEGKTLDSVDNYTSRISALEEELKAEGISEEDKKAKEEELSALKDEKKDAESLIAEQKKIDDANASIANVKEYVDTDTNTATSKLVDEVTDAFVNKVSYAHKTLGDLSAGKLNSTGATKVNGQDAVIILNDAEFKNNSNSFEINGLTFTALSETKEGEAVTVTTQDDTDGIYDMVRNFINEYNSVINELDKLYNAEAVKMDPLLQEEKDALSETEVKDVEEKLKGSALRRDENVSAIASALKDAMNVGIEVDGKTMYLFDFGINNLGYFNAPDNEKNAFHIDGDDKDDNTSGNADKLKGLISSDPNAVISFFSQLSQKLYSNMSEVSKSKDGYRSFGNFYDDKKMKTEYTDFNSKIAEMEKKVNDYEDKWYAKFAKMEKAMAKMQSNASGITSLLGGM